MNDTVPKVDFLNIGSDISVEGELGSGVDTKGIVNFAGGVSTFFIALVGLVLNTVSFVVFRNFKIQNSSTFLLRCLAVADNFYILSQTFFISIPSIFSYIELIPGTLPFISKHTRVLWSLNNWLILIPIWISVLVTIDRYRLICSSTSQLLDTSSLKTWVGRVAVVVIASFVSVIPKYFFIVSIGFRPCLLNKTYPFCFKPPVVRFPSHKIYWLAFHALFYFCFPFFIITKCNVQIIRRLRALSNRREVLFVQKMTTYRELTKIVIMIAVSSLVFHLLYCCTFIIGFYPEALPQNMTRNMPLFFQVLTFCGVLNSSMNFFIYGVFGKTFQRTLKSMCCSRCTKGDERKNHVKKSSRATFDDHLNLEQDRFELTHRY